MQTLTIQITSIHALKTLHAFKKQFITILDECEIDSPALPGSRLSLNAFKN